MLHKNQFINFLVNEIMRKSNATYVQALSEVRQFEKTDRFKKSYQQWDELQRKKRKRFYSGPRHAIDTIKRMIE